MRRKVSYTTRAQQRIAADGAESLFATRRLRFAPPLNAGRWAQNAGGRNGMLPTTPHNKLGAEGEIASKNAKGLRAVTASCLHRYWFEFDFSPPQQRSEHHALLARGCGITAYDYPDALYIMRRCLLHDADWPTFRVVIVDVDVSTLEHDHVFVNAGVPVWRGVWFPALNMWYGPFAN